jgi:acyl carrier protein
MKMELKRPFSIVKKNCPRAEPSELKTFETLNIDSFDALQFIVALDES